MTPRTGLYVALVGLVMAVLCLATLFLLRDWNPPGATVSWLWTTGSSFSWTWG